MNKSQLIEAVAADILAVDHNRAIRTIAQGDVEDGAVLGDVDFLAAEHLFGPARHVALDRQDGRDRGGDRAQHPG